MAMTKLVSIISASIGNPQFELTLASIERQTYRNIQHLIFCDGPQAAEKVRAMTARQPTALRRDIIELPYAVGNERWNGHRMYGAACFLCDGDYMMFLDDDNFIEPTHVDDCLKACATHSWSYSLRKIVDQEGKCVCNDDCESLGKWPSVLNPDDYFVDVNCYFLPRQLAVQLSPLWQRKAREPGVMEVDRALCRALREAAPSFECTYKYTLNYRVGSTGLSVTAGFYLKYNKIMLERCNGVLPWAEKVQENR